MDRNNNTQQEFSKKYFTIEEAEILLPKIEKILRRTIQLDKAIELLSSIEIEVYDDYANIEKLEDMGCLIKDLDTGLMDFYYRFEGRDIFLCWKLGENGIKFWHEADTGYMGRKQILDISKK